MQFGGWSLACLSMKGNDLWMPLVTNSYCTNSKILESGTTRIAVTSVRKEVLATLLLLKEKQELQLKPL